MATPDYMTVKEAAEYLERDESQVRRYIREGRLAAVDLGKQWLLKRADVLEFRHPPRGNPNLRKTLP